MQLLVLVLVLILILVLRKYALLVNEINQSTGNIPGRNCFLLPDDGSTSWMGSSSPTESLRGRR